jgi:hypothetical protein
MPQRIVVSLTQEMAAALLAMARAERRESREQAAWLLEQALAAWQARTPPMEVK